MNDYVEAYADEERSTTTDYSVSMGIDPEQQINSTIEFTTHAEPLSATMEINAESTRDHRTDSDDLTSFMDVSSANAPVIMPVDDDHRDYYNILRISFVQAFRRKITHRIKKYISSNSPHDSTHFS